MCLSRPLKQAESSAMPLPHLRGLCFILIQRLGGDELVGTMFWLCSGAVFQILILRSGGVFFLDFKEKYLFLSLSLLLASERHAKT